VLNRCGWSALAAAQILFLMLIDRFAGPGPVVIGLDDTIERRWGAKIKARGIYRDPVRSSHGHFVKASGLRWLSAMLLVPVPWSGRIWSLPFLTILVTSERSAAERGVKHKTLIDGARQVMLQIVRWLPDRRIVVVADSGFSAIDLLAAVRTRVCMVTRLRLDARLFAPATPRKSGTMGRPRKTGERLPTLAKRLADPQTIWQALIVPAWYGGTERLVEVATGVAVWSHPGRPVVPLGWLLVRDPAGLSVHRSGGWPGGHPFLVRPTLDRRGHLCRGPPSSGRRNPAAMVGQGHRSHHAGAARALRSRGDLGRRSPSLPDPGRALAQLVPQNRTLVSTPV